MKEYDISKVIEKLEEVIQTCLAENSRAGYFAVLYHRVTCRIRDGILRKEFEDNERMERLDVLFAIRYINAWEAWRAGTELTASWKLAFEMTAVKDAVVLQHLLLGINAHINLDLGIAAVETMKDESLMDIEKDFIAINGILARLVDEVQHNIGRISPLMFLFDMFCKGYDEMMVCFSIDRARDGAWLFANELYGKKGTVYTACISERDSCIAELGRKISGVKNFTFILKCIRFCEWRQPRDVITMLGQYINRNAP